MTRQRECSPLECQCIERLREATKARDRVQAQLALECIARWHHDRERRAMAKAILRTPAWRTEAA
jgi:hypothetical protein